MIIGDNSDIEFRNLHKATVGDVVTVDFYAKDSYSYKIKQIEVNITKDEIADYKADNRLILCKPYKNFEQDGTYFYSIYIADLIEEWGALYEEKNKRFVTRFQKNILLSACTHYGRLR